jgi:cytochrome c-type biogenesis protein CcmE
MLKKNPRNRKKQRIKFIITASAICLAAMIFIIVNFRDSIVFFYSPAELQNIKTNPKKIIRVGGMVKTGSIKYLSGKIEFIITDYKADLKISYQGIKPDLFREEQGTIAKGYLGNNGVFIAKELLTKHDEKYMPPEVKKAIDKNHI